jgi:CRP-like cAMP-binding protein
MFGKVIFLTLNTISYSGKEPSAKTKEEIDQAKYVRIIDTGMDNLTKIEMENVIAEYSTPKLFGEIALLDETKKVRALSAMTKTDAVLCILNHEAFDMMIREKLNREREELGKFVHKSVPKLKEYFGLQTVI